MAKPLCRAFLFFCIFPSESNVCTQGMFPHVFSHWLSSPECLANFDLLYTIQSISWIPSLNKFLSLLSILCIVTFAFFKYHFFLFMILFCILVCFLLFITFMASPQILLGSFSYAPFSSAAFTILCRSGHNEEGSHLCLNWAGKNR